MEIAEEQLNGIAIETFARSAYLAVPPLELSSMAVAAFGAMQKKEEFAALLDIVSSGHPRRILEIGFGNGGTSWAWSKLESLEQLVIVNLPGGPWGGGDDGEMLKYIAGNSKARIDYIAGNSQNAECLEAVEARLGANNNDAREFNLVDFLFIDGDHSAVGVAADYDLYKKFVRPGGLIAFHDVREHPPETKCEVKVFWDALKKDLPEDRYCEFIAEDDAAWGGIGIIKV